MEGIQFDIDPKIISGTVCFDKIFHSDKSGKYDDVINQWNIPIKTSNLNVYYFRR
jgi:hypothetical protein